MKRIIASLIAALALSCGPAHALGSFAQQYASGCTGTIATYYLDVGAVAPLTPYLYVDMASGMGFKVAKTDPLYSDLVSTVRLAKLTGGTVSVYFTAAGVNCAAAGYRTDTVVIAP